MCCFLVLSSVARSGGYPHLGGVGWLGCLIVCLFDWLVLLVFLS